MIDFRSKIVETNSEQQRMPLLWQWAESYTNVFSGKEYKISHIDPKTRKYILEENLLADDVSFMSTLFKILSYATIILPGLAYGIKFYYRKSRPCVEYRLSEQISKIDRACRLGQSLALYWGKKDDECLPTEEGVVWVSLHEDMINEPREDRIHLKMDIESQTAFNSISKINLVWKFQKITITGDKFKSLDRPLDSLIKLMSLKNRDELEIMIKALSVTPCLDKSNEGTIPEYNIDKMILAYPRSITRDQFDNWRKNLIEQRREAFQKRFSSVDVYRYDDEKGDGQIGWTLKGLKSQE